jgi:hypothetical protein
MIFSKLLRSENHTRTFMIADAGARGWEVREEEDSRVVRSTRLHDWHRVETAIMRFAIEATHLQQTGWIEIQPVEQPA